MYTPLKKEKLLGNSLNATDNVKAEKEFATEYE